MEVSESQPIASKLVQVWRLDLATKAAQIAETQVICHDDQEVGPFGFIGRSHVALKVVGLVCFGFKDATTNSTLGVV